ncbi:LysM peptidoglycan-binding domain-containing protein [Paenisporosarcina indica]|uniref:LysM peptidoglycan-binding domain-containing protein n=1 Tax=Paenisporosarcina indica TaxID=650093 RepID=UPI0009502C73|nr:LysM peptidoglycan-binding domain-containing protein [Paenisporosarcina indica]
MNKDDYQNKIEEHRKPIEINSAEEPNTRKSRRTNPSVSKQSKKQKRNYLLPILFFFFILIPVSFLIYVFVFYQPSSNGVTVVDNSQVQYEQNEKEDVADTSPDDESTDPLASDVDPKDSEASEETTIPEETTVPEDQPAAPPVEQPSEVPSEPQPTSDKTHVVQPGENLYRIALKYYPSGGGVDLIKSANNLTSDSISSGQTLIIPN